MHTSDKVHWHTKVGWVPSGMVATLEHERAGASRCIKWNRVKLKDRYALPNTEFHLPAYELVS